MTDQIPARAEPNQAETTESAPNRAMWAMFALVGAAGVWFVWARRSDIPLAWQALRAASPLWLAVAAALSLAIMVNQALFCRSSQRALGVHLPSRDLWRSSNAAFFINTVAKSGGLAGMTAFTASASRNARSRSRTVAAYVVVATMSQLGFAAALIASVLVLLRSVGLTRADVIGAIIFGIYTVVLAVTVTASFQKRSLIRRIHALPTYVSRATSHLLRRPTSDAPIDTTEADELYEAMQILRHSPRALLPTLGHALLVEILGIALLWATLRAVGAGVGLTVPLVAYAVSVMFFIIGFLPGGLGFVEASLGVVLAGFGVATGSVAASVLLYRVLQLWIPFAVGAVAARPIKTS